mmetsp:Transcript_59684/g.158862  ORF Transcript_59684/g.158862 Transcript_59684/m.158862 type:complete len:145 (+) Transcript_59684:552-986(+)
MATMPSIAMGSAMPGMVGIGGVRGFAGQPDFDGMMAAAMAQAEQTMAHVNAIASAHMSAACPRAAYLHPVALVPPPQAPALAPRVVRFMGYVAFFGLTCITSLARRPPPNNSAPAVAFVQTYISQPLPPSPQYFGSAAPSQYRR